MRMILSARRHHHLVRVSIFLIMVPLIAGIVGCGDGSKSYTLTISSTAGGSVTIPGEGTFTYDEGTVVNLTATPDDGYGFQAWTRDIQDIADPNSRATTITMHGKYSITANFGQTGPPGPSVP